MLDIGFYHPLVVHFAIGLVMVGVLFRWISFSGRASLSTEKRFYERLHVYHDIA
ncbi:MAG TPA: hypothetical protein VKK81_06145 [Candidatus Binatia bacterium]|nr:hypothetical protein [Candidatus Binatia bacterium]